MIYLGDNWPDRVPQHALHAATSTATASTTTSLERNGSRLRRPATPRTSCSPTTPGSAASRCKYGPDGGVYVTDWTDTGECHNYDRSIAPRQRPHLQGHLRQAEASPRSTSRSSSDEELAQLQLHKNDWYARTARRLLQERAAAGKLARDGQASDARRNRDRRRDVPHRLRAIWALNATGGLDRRA